MGIGRVARAESKESGLHCPGTGGDEKTKIWLHAPWSHRDEVVELFVTPALDSSFTTSSKRSVATPAWGNMMWLNLAWLASWFSPAPLRHFPEPISIPEPIDPLSMPEEIDTDVLRSPETAPSVWQSECIRPNQQERSQAEAEIGIETISNDRRDASDLMRLCTVRYYAGAGSFSTAIR